MNFVNPKKYLGQHFLRDENIARKIIGSLDKNAACILEIGAGTGVLTKYLLDKVLDLKVIEIDDELVDHLYKNYPDLKGKVIHADFLKSDISKLFNGNFSIIGNFPYNISSQIFFKILDNRNLITQVVCMIQKEVAERISSPPGNKTYGILSVLLGAFYEIENLFTVSENVFFPQPKVKSAVIRLTRKSDIQLTCSEKLFFTIVKTAFNQRRKTLKNSLKIFWKNKFDPEPFDIFKKRPEQLSVKDFFALTQILLGE